MLWLTLTARFTPGLALSAGLSLERAGSKCADAKKAKTTRNGLSFFISFFRSSCHHCQIIINQAEQIDILWLILFVWLRA